MKTNPKLNNVVLVYLNTTFQSILRNRTKFELNNNNKMNSILAFNAISFSAFVDHGFFNSIYIRAVQ